MGKRPDTLAVHSIDHFALDVPDLDTAKTFYEAFGLEVRVAGEGLELYSRGHSHRWATVCQGPQKHLRYLSFGAYAEDFESLVEHLKRRHVNFIPSPSRTDDGVWFEGFDGLPINVRIAEKSTPDAKSEFLTLSAGPGRAGTVLSSQAPKVYPRRLSHFALFTTDVEAAITYYRDTLGLRLSDQSGPFVAFLHAPHGSDHHLLALVKSDHRGMHHISWDVGSVQEVGLGAGQMARAGYKYGWGLGRHVLGANYFHYVRDPWGSYCEYSADIDYIPADCDWQAGDHAPEDSMYLWGPDVPEDFITNFEAA